MEKQQDNDYPKHGVAPTDQKQSTEKLNITKSKIELSKGRLELLRKPDPFFSSGYTITSD